MWPPLQQIYLYIHIQIYPSDYRGNTSLKYGPLSWVRVLFECLLYFKQKKKCSVRLIFIFVTLLTLFTEKLILLQIPIRSISTHFNIWIYNHQVMVWPPTPRCQTPQEPLNTNNIHTSMNKNWTEYLVNGGKCGFKSISRDISTPIPYACMHPPG